MIDHAIVMAGLYAKEAELVRDVDSLLKKMDRLRADLFVVKAAEALHRQEVDNIDFMPHMSVRKQFKRGEVQRYCLDALKASGGCLDTRQLAAIVADRKGLDSLDMALRKKIVGSVMQAMKTARRHRLVVDDGKQFGVRLWRLAPANVSSRARAKGGSNGA